MSARSSIRSAMLSFQLVREYMERKGFILQEKFIFIDGRSGAQICILKRSAKQRLYNENDNTPAFGS